MSMITVQQAYGDDAIINKFPKPDYSFISPNIGISDAIKIPFNKIYIDDFYLNVARNDKADIGARVANLVVSFGLGLLTGQELPSVQHRGLDENGKEYDKPYILKYGFGRCLALIEMGLEGWFFNVLIGTEKELEDVCSAENEDFVVKTPNKEQDIIVLKSKQVAKGTLPNNEGAIKRDLKKTYPRRAKASLDRIAAGIFETNSTPVSYEYYTDAKIRLWRDNHCSVWFADKGKWDRRIQSFGFTSKIGGLYRTFHRALNKYAETGFVSYVNVYTGEVMKGSTLEEQRVSIINDYIRLRVNHAIVYGKDEKFLTLNGFFPQSYGVDKWSSFINIDQVELEKKIKSAISLAKKLKKVRSAA